MVGAIQCYLPVVILSLWGPPESTGQVNQEKGVGVLPKRCVQAM